MARLQVVERPDPDAGPQGVHVAAGEELNRAFMRWVVRMPPGVRADVHSASEKPESERFNGGRYSPSRVRSHQAPVSRRSFQVLKR